MNSLGQFVHQKRGALSLLAREVAVSHAQLSRVAAGKSQPSPELARRIERATGGEVSAASLLGLAGTGGSAQRLNEGRWLLNRAEDGSVTVSPAVLAEMGFGEGDRLLIRSTEGGAEVISTDAKMRRLREEFSKLREPGRSVVDEFIAERRAEAAREDAE